MGALPAGWGLPELTPTNETWFTSAALAVQQCVACATLQHPPEEICHSCLGTEFGTTTLAPSGTVHSYTVVHYATNPALLDAVPYAVVLVALDDAPHLRVVGNMPETPLDEVRIGLRVVPYWEDRVAEDGAVVRLPQWRPARSLRQAARAASC